MYTIDIARTSTLKIPPRKHNHGSLYDQCELHSLFWFVPACCDLDKTFAYQKFLALVSTSKDGGERMANEGSNSHWIVYLSEIKMTKTM